MTFAERVQASIRAVNAAERESVPAGVFTLYRHLTSDHPYLNYAVPNAGAERWEAIDALREAFASRGLHPRLEFVAECAPGLEDALARSGFALEMRIPVMTCPAAGLRDVPVPEGIRIAPVAVAADVRAYLEVGAEAFGESPRALPPARDRGRDHRRRGPCGVRRRRRAVLPDAGRRRRRARVRARRVRARGHDDGAHGRLTVAARGAALRS